MRRWLRVTLPPDVYIAAFVGLYLLIEMLPRLLGARGEGGELLIRLALIAYGGFRVSAFHPVFNADYRNWLASTPWTSRLPLPVGPVHLVIQDVLVAGALLALAAMLHPGMSLVSAGLCFILSYVSVMTASFSLLRMRLFAYGLVFGMGLLILTWTIPTIALTVAVVLYAISQFGLRRALREFAAWNVEWMNEHQIQPLSLQKMVDRMKQNILGWPFDYIRPQDVSGITYRDGVLVCLLVGWWIFVVMHRIDAAVRIDPLGAQIAVGVFCQFALPARLFGYCWGYAPPISFWGRVFTLRWVIPGYDQVFVAPLLALVVTIASATPQVRTFLNLPVVVQVPLAVTLVLLILVNGGPSLQRWRLTGNHRLSSAALTKNAQAELQQI